MTRALALLLFCAAARGQIRFEESAVPFVLRNGAKGDFHLPELMVGGVGVLDYDRDGCMDLYFANGAAMPSLKKSGPEFYNRLFHNDCHGHFTDVTAKAGVAGEGYSIAVAIADYDRDGYPDIFVAGVNRNLLFHNRGDGTFEERANAAGLMGKGEKPWSISAGFFDMDNDGWPDLFISNYVKWDAAKEPACGSPQQRFYCHPNMYPGNPHQLFRNNRDGTFTDISESSGIAAHAGKGMGVAFADFNGDGRTDIYIANDSMRNFLFENLGGGRFREAGLEYGASLGDAGRAIAAMAVDFRDYDNDGRPDLFITGMINDSFLLFHNSGSPYFFEDRTAASGLAAATHTLTGWGGGFADFDNDGWKDIFAANGHFPQMGRLIGSPSPLRNTLYRNLGDGRFRDVSAGAGLGGPAYHRGVAFADFDGDGLVDVIVTRVDEPARLYRNATKDAGRSIVFDEPLGTEVEVELPNGRKLYNHSSTSVGYASSSEPGVRFGIGRLREPDSVRVRRPGEDWKSIPPGAGQKRADATAPVR
jgi:hypothetical protein